MKNKIEVVPLGMLIEKLPEEVMDDQGAVLGFVRLNNNGRVSLNWIHLLFDPKSPVHMTDWLRRSLVALLRKHADGLETRELDKRTLDALPIAEAMLRSDPKKKPD